MSVSWPAILLNNTPAEIAYIESTRALSEERILPGSILIDKLAKIYAVIDSATDYQFIDAGKQCPLETLINYTQLYATQSGVCCAAKIGAKNTAEVFQQLAYLSRL